MVIVTFVLVCLAPAAFFLLFSRAFDRFTGATERVPARFRRRAAAPADRSVDYARELRRLGTEHARLIDLDVPGKLARLRAIDLAYDDTLRRACQALDLQVPGLPMDPVDRLHTEAELVVHGVIW